MWHLCADSVNLQPTDTRDDLRFSNTTGILQKKKTMWFIGVEVEQETSAPPPKKNPGSAPAYQYQLINWYRLASIIAFIDWIPWDSTTHDIICAKNTSWLQSAGICNETNMRKKILLVL